MKLLKLGKRGPAHALAFNDVEDRFRGCVVTAERARWKSSHFAVTEQMVRMIRFIWMRKLDQADLTRLHAGVLGACMTRGLVMLHEGKLCVTDLGEDWLESDRRK